MYDGILTVDKPEGFTSHDVVAKIRRLLSQKRVGHAGTLDPLATGVLTILLGVATRASDYASALDKEYEAKLLLGVSTDTQDITGKRLCEKPPAGESELRAVLPRFEGELMQTPPMYSAVSVGGKRLYELARRGEEVKREARKITVESIEVIDKLSEREYLLRIKCSKGTYIRTLLSDIGEALSCGGCMSALRRTRAGSFSVSDALTLSETEAFLEKGELSSRILPTDSVFSGYRAITVNEYGEKRVINGAFLDGEALLTGSFDGEKGEILRVYTKDGVFTALARVDELSRGGLAAFPFKSFRIQG